MFLPDVALVEHYKDPLHQEERHFYEATSCDHLDRDLICIGHKSPLGTDVIARMGRKSRMTKISYDRKGVK